MLRFRSKEGLGIYLLPRTLIQNSAASQNLNKKEIKNKKVTFAWM